jgi:hypothetical protein
MISFCRTVMEWMFLEFLEIDRKSQFNSERVMSPIVATGDCTLEGFHDIYLEQYAGNNFNG